MERYSVSCKKNTANENSSIRKYESMKVSEKLSKID